MEEANSANELREHAVYGIVHDVRKADSVRYVVHWYRQAPANDMVEPLATFPTISLHINGAGSRNKLQAHREET